VKKFQSRVGLVRAREGASDFQP